MIIFQENHEQINDNWFYFGLLMLNLIQIIHFRIWPMFNAIEEILSKSDPLIQSWCKLEELVYHINESNYVEILELIKTFDRNYIYSIGSMLSDSSEYNPLCFKLLGNMFRSLKISSRQLQFSALATYVGLLDEDKTDDVTRQINNYETNFEEGSIEHCIINDDVSQLSIHATQKNLLSFEVKIKSHELFLNLLEFAALCGSAQVFNYLMLNGFNLEDKIAKHVVLGENEEIFEICVQNGINFSQFANLAISAHRNTIFEWIIQTYNLNLNIQENGTFKYKFNTAFDLYFASSGVDLSLILERSARGNFLIFKYLVEQKNAFITPETMFYAAQNCQYGILEYLLNRGLDINVKIRNNYIIYEPLRTENIEMVKFILSKGFKTYVLDSNKRNLLFRVNMRNGIEMMKILIKSGVKVNQKDENGQTVLFEAVANGTDEMIMFLVKNGANIEMKDNEGNTPLLYAITHANRKRVIFLCETLNANKSVVNSSGMNVTHLCAMNDNIALLEYFANNDVNFDLPDKTKSTPLLRGAGFGRIVTYLVAIGADVNFRNKDGWTPLARAVDNDSIVSVQELIRRGANVDVVDKKKWSPLHRAAYKGYTNIVRCLLKNGANIELKNDAGLTAAELTNDPQLQQLIDSYQD